MFVKISLVRKELMWLLWWHVPGAAVAMAVPSLWRHQLDLWAALVIDSTSWDQLGYITTSSSLLSFNSLCLNIPRANGLTFHICRLLYLSYPVPADGQALNSLRPSDTYALVNYAITGSDNGLSLVRCLAIIWTNAGLLSIQPLGINFSEISIESQTFSVKKMHLK